MRSSLILILYLSDQMLSLMLPFSSGLFAIGVIAIGLYRVAFCWDHLAQIFFAGTVATAAGLVGAVLSGTPVSVFFMATIAMFIGVWIVGAGLSEEDSVFISSESAFVGVLISSGFLLLSVLGWDAISLVQGAATNRGSGIYFEPSHYALFVMPLWLIAYQRRQYRALLLAILAFSFIKCFSITLLSFLVCALVIHVYLGKVKNSSGFCPQVRRTVIGALLVVFAYGLSTTLTVDGVLLQDYVGTRLTGLVIPDEMETYNLTSLVVLQGLELAQSSFSESLGLGVGLGNLGTSDLIIDQSSYRTLINGTINGNDLNLRDGGILASKLVGELGVFALVVALIVMRYVRGLKTTLQDNALGYRTAFLVTLICLLFVRALPYFSAPVCLAILSMVGVLLSRGRVDAVQVIKLPNSRTQVAD